MAYSIILTKSAIKELADLPPKQHDKVIERLRQIEADPRIHGSQKLKGRPEYKVRVGDYRIVYGIDDSEKKVTVFLIDDRKHVYKKLRRK